MRISLFFQKKSKFLEIPFVFFSLILFVQAVENSIGSRLPIHPVPSLGPSRRRPNLKLQRELEKAEDKKRSESCPVSLKHARNSLAMVSGDVFFNQK
jgi:hypothetical protein